MASTYSTDLRLELIGTGEQQGTWGVTTNKNIGTLIEQAIAGGISQDITGLATYTLTAYDGLTDQARAAFLRFTGTLIGTCNIIAPSVSKSYIIRNDTTGGYPIQIKTATGAVMIVPAGESSIVECNGLDFYSALTCINDDARVTGDLAVDGALTASSFSLTSPLPVLSGGTGVTTSTGTTNVVLSNSPTLVTPNLGTPSALIGTNITGTATAFTASNVTTNANLTGVITSTGNATSIASQTGTGTKFVVDDSPTLITPNLGTPAALVGTNITGTATAFTASNVTTNANLTGGVTSVGNAATVVTNANLTGGVTSIGNAATVITNANLTGGVTSVGNAATVITNANLTGGVTSVGNAATVVTNANLTGGVTSIGNAATVVTNANLTGEATSVGNAVTLTNSAVIGKVITGYVSGAGAVSATDTLLQAIQKLNGNTAAIVSGTTKGQAIAFSIVFGL